MKSPKAFLVLAGLLVVGVSATRWATRQEKSAPDALRDSASSETGSRDGLGDASSFLDRAKKNVDKNAAGKSVAGTPIRATSAIADVYCSSSKNSGVNLIDPDLQNEEQGSWSWTTKVRVVSEKDPKGLELTIWGGSSKPPTQPRPDQPITSFHESFYYLLGESGFRGETPALGINVFDTVRVLYKGEVVASCEMIGNEGEITVLKGVGLKLPNPGMEGLPEETLIQLSDQDLNKDPTAIDRAEIKVFSDSDRKGITVKATETAINTANFLVSVLLTRGPTQGYSLHAKPGDKLHAVYFDEHTPERGKSRTIESVAEITE